MKVERSIKRQCRHFVKRMMLLLISFIFMSSLYAQERQITGVISDDQGGPLPGASVLVEGTTIGSAADVYGNYSIKAPQNAVLIFSFVGYLSERVTVSDKTVIDVKLVPDIKNLDEVVVIGYGAVPKRDLTGAVGSINSGVIDKSVSTTFDQALQGRIAGVQIVQNSGIPGGGTSIQIRGVNSINNTNEPIYVIDGVIISGNTGSNNTNAMAGINPSDIDNIEVLKDASATAIYGAQAANGVILITMKKGKTAKPVINFNAYYGKQQLIKTLPMMNLYDYAVHYNDWQLAQGYPSNRRSDFNDPASLGKGTNWQREIFKDAPMASYNLSVRGSNQGTTYSVSGGYFDQDGITTGSGFTRSTFRAEVDSKATDKFQVGSALNLSYTNQNTAITTWSAVPYALFQAPYIPALALDGTYGGPSTSDDANAGYNNPLANAQLTQRTDKRFDARGNVYASFTPLKWLNFRTELSGDANVDNFQYFFPAFTAGAYVNPKTTNDHSKTFVTNWTWRNLLNINYEISKVHKINAVIGHEVNAIHSDYLFGERLNGSTVLTGLDAGDANSMSNQGNSYDRKIVSVFGRVFYSFKDRYQLTGTLRYDGSSNFVKGHQWGLFPSAAIAWRVSEEEFFAGLKPVINNLKFRLSYGAVGNSNVTGNYVYASLLSNVQSNFGPSFQTANIPNSDLKWETTKSWNFGTDLNLLNNRIEFIFDTYVKKTDDLIMQAQLPGYLGTNGTGSAAAPWLNIGSLQNKGWEFSLNTINIDGKNIKWSTSFTFSRNRNKITKMNSDNANIDKSYTNINSTYSDIVTRTSAGAPISQFYGYKTHGRIDAAGDFLQNNGDGNSTVAIATPTYAQGQIISNTNPNLPASTYIGDLIFRDINGDGIINANDKTFIGNPLPKCTGGLTNTFTYKNIDLSFFLYFSYGNKVMNLLRARIDDPRGTTNLSMIAGNNYAKLGYYDGNSANTDIWNIYVLPGADASEVRMGARDPNLNYAVSSRYVEDGSFLRIQNISLGYTLPDKVSKMLRVSKLRIYSNIQNVYTFTKYSGYDPEVGSTQASYSFSGQNLLMYGVDAGRVPTPRVYTVGLDLTF